jgi:hypothetical protein
VGNAYAPGGAYAPGRPWTGTTPYVCLDFSKATLDAALDPETVYDPVPTPVFTRTGTATLVDFEGNVIEVPADTPRFQGARAVRNYTINSSAVASYVWKTTKTSNVDEVDGIVYNGYASTDGTRMDILFQAGQFDNPPYFEGVTVTVSLYLKKAPGSPDAFVFITIPGSVGQQNIIIDHEEPRRYAFTGIVTNDANYPNIRVQQQFGKYDINTDFHIGGVQFEVTQGQSNQNPSEYIDTSGSSLSAQFFPYENGNTVDANGVVTEAKGADIDGIAYLNEPSATNYFLNSDDPVTQTVNGLTGTHVFWINGSGSMVLSGGATGTVTEGNPVRADPAGAGVTCTISGDVIRAQVEAAPGPSSYIPTAGGPVTRGADNLKYLDVDINEDISFLIDQESLYAGNDYASADIRILASPGGDPTTRTYGDGASGAGWDIHPIGGYRLSNAEVSNEERVRVGAVRTSTEGLIALDGELKFKDAVASSMPHSVSDTYEIGHWSRTGEVYAGLFYRVMLFDVALSEDEVIDLSGNKYSCPEGK